MTRRACSRCDKIPEFPDYLTGRSGVCMGCWRKADRQKAALQKVEIAATKKRHPAGKARPYNFHTHSTFCGCLETLGVDD